MIVIPERLRLFHSLLFSQLPYRYLQNCERLPGLSTIDFTLVPRIYRNAFLAERTWAPRSSYTRWPCMLAITLKSGLFWVSRCIIFSMMLLSSLYSPGVSSCWRSIDTTIDMLTRLPTSIFLFMSLTFNNMLISLGCFIVTDLFSLQVYSMTETW